LEATRRSGRIAEKTQKAGRKNAEEMAQDLLHKKVDGISSAPDKEEQARSSLLKLFDAPLPEDAMEAIEELLKVTKLDDIQTTAVNKGKKKAVAPA
jgi:hypothetical protein